MSSRAPAHARPSSERSWLIPALAFLLGLVLFVTSAAYFAYSRVQGNINSADITNLLGEDRPTEDGKTLEPFMEGRPVNLLLLGSDVRNEATGGEDSDIEGMRSDTTMLVHISENRDRVEIISIPRDLLTDIPACRLPNGEWTNPHSNTIFNSAFTLGGQTDDVGAAAACTIRTVEKFTGIYIDGFMVVDFASFRSFVNALGGVDMCFQEAIDDPAADLNIPAGCHTLNGDQALGYARARKTLGDGSDIGRMSRQQDLVKAMIDEALSKNLTTDLPRLYSFIDAISQSVVLSKDLGDVDTLAALGLSVRGVKTDDMFMMTMPWEPAGARVTEAPEAEIVWEALREDQPLEELFDADGVYIGDSTTETTTTIDETDTTQGQQ